MIQVAIADDVRVVRQSLTEKINASGVAKVCFAASNGSEFLEKMKEAKERPTAVLMDIEMPVMNGIDAVCIARELYPEVNFIMLTSFDEDDKIFDAIKAGASGYLLKGETAERIIQALVQADEGAPMSPRIARKTLKFMQSAPPPVKEQQQANGDDLTLSAREMEILGEIVNGLNYQQIAEKLFISPLTVKKHIKNIYAKLHVNSKLSAVKVAMKKGWFAKLLSL